jgi:type I restriction enzyme, S subunit
MSEWKEEILDNLAVVDPEQLSLSTVEDFTFFYIDIGSVSEGHIDYPVSQIEYKGSPSRARKILKINDVLMSTVRPNLKSFAKFNRVSRSNFVASTGFAILRAKKETDIDFIYHSLFSEKIERQIQTLVVGSNYPAINSSDVRKLIFNVPDYPTQRRIARILSTTDAVIEKTQAAIAKYKAIKQGMLHDLFTRGIVTEPTSYKDKTGKVVELRRNQLRPKYEDAPELYKESKLGWIPKEWEVDSLSNLCSEKPTYGINAAAVDFTYHLPTYLRITDIDEDGNFSKTGKKCVNSSFSNDYILNQGDLVFARTGATVGKTYLYNEADGILVYAGFLIKVHPDEKVLNYHFLKFLTETPYYLNWVELMSQRSGQPGINGNEYGKLTVPKPKLNEQELFSKLLLSIKNKIQTEQSYLHKLQQIKAGLMADLLSGRKGVKIDS